MPFVVPCLPLAFVLIAVLVLSTSFINVEVANDHHE